MAMAPKDIAEMLAAKVGAGASAPGGGDTEAAPSGDGDGDEAGPDEGEMAAAEDMIHALKGGDAQSLASSLKAFIQMCTSKDDY